MVWDLLIARPVSSSMISGFGDVGLAVAGREFELVWSKMRTPTASVRGRGRG